MVLQIGPPVKVVPCTALRAAMAPLVRDAYFAELGTTPEPAVEE